MTGKLCFISLFLMFAWTPPVLVFGQETDVTADAEQAEDPDAVVVVDSADETTDVEVEETVEADVDEEVAEGVDRVTEGARDIADGTRDAVDDFAERVDESESAEAISAGLLSPIYALAEAIAFPAFYWLAFAFMVTGAISFALQLVLGKIVVLARMGFSFTEIIADAVGLIISLIGLVLTTQAATENSNFTQSPAAVISSAVIGIVAGFILYLWGQSQEVQAAKGRKYQKIEERHAKK